MKKKWKPMTPGEKRLNKYNKKSEQITDSKTLKGSNNRTLKRSHKTQSKGQKI